MRKPSAKDFTVGQQVREIVRQGAMEYDAVVVGIGERELVVQNIGAEHTGSIPYSSMDSVNGNVIVIKGAYHNVDLVGVQEAALLLGWDKRKVSTYMIRGSFPEPIQRLASGSIWTKQQILDYKKSTVKGLESSK